MDEPSVGQDDDSLGRILRRLDRFVREGGALLTATHDVRVARALAHRTLILANGRLSAGDREAAKTFFDNGPGPKAANPIQPAHEAPIHRPDSDIQRVFNRHEGR
jgi:energy-coupling factor transporter ATP-binding protein EcfA2